LCGVQHGGDRGAKRKNCVLITQDDIAKELGVSVRTIQNLKKLQTLSPELQELIEDGTVKYTTALSVWGKLGGGKPKLIRLKRRG
jgi:ParB-like chromosome segregation protein Spo0J